jgi:hypothetical protein
MKEEPVIVFLKKAYKQEMRFGFTGKEDIPDFIGTDARTERALEC